MFLVSTFKSVHLDSIIFTANKIKANYAGYLALTLQEVLHMIWVLGLSQVSSKWKLIQNITLLKLYLLTRMKTGYILITGATPEEEIWNKWYY